MQGERVRPLSLERPEAYRYQGRDRARYEKLNQVPTTQPDSFQPNTLAETTRYRKKMELTPVAQLDFLERTAMDAQVSSDDIIRMTRNHKPVCSRRTYQSRGEWRRFVDAIRQLYVYWIA